MEQILIITPIVLALLVGAMSPGPSFIIVAKVSLSGSRKEGLATAVGLGIGSALFGLLALTGLHIVLQQVGWLYLVFKVFGGCYLLFLSYKIFLGASSSLEFPVDPAEAEGKISLTKALFLGVATQLSNPKTAIVFAGVFATFIPNGPETWIYLTLIPMILLVEILWYGILAFAFSAEKSRTVYTRAKTAIDRTTSFILGAMGLSLIKSSL